MKQTLNLHFAGQVLAKSKEQRILAARKDRETYTVEITMYEPNRIRRDLDNQASTIMDALTRAGAIADDCWQFVKKMSVEAGGVSPTPGADIKITIETD
jgi:Holliday junction resolvase RusA-like endonuclease